jgi:hypothetical protein
VARKCERGDRDEWRFKHDRANRQDPNLMFCLTVHHILALEAMDRSRPIGKTAPWNSPAIPRIARSGRRFDSTTGADLGGPADDPPERHTAGPLPASIVSCTRHLAAVHRGTMRVWLALLIWAVCFPDRRRPARPRWSLIQPLAGPHFLGNTPPGPALGLLVRPLFRRLSARPPGRLAQARGSLL